MLRSQSYALLGLLCLLLSGCQSGKPGEPKKYPVSGTVTLDGQPVNENGLIYFKTVATGTIDGFEIKAGKFSGRTEPGERRVEIEVFQVTVKDFNGMKGESRDSLIPASYNTDSKLTATINPAGPNEFKFELKSK